MDLFTGIWLVILTIAIILNWVAAINTRKAVNSIIGRSFDYGNLRPKGIPISGSTSAIDCMKAEQEIATKIRGSHSH